ncbi:immunity 53 family protein [Paenibacillus sp. CAU 1782]
MEEWYERQCNEDWEHTNGIKLDTIDNPGWVLEISLEETELEEKYFKQIDIERSETDWIHCRVENWVFKGYGGVKNLQEIIRTFKEWTELETK